MTSRSAGRLHLPGQYVYAYADGQLLALGIWATGLEPIDRNLDEARDVAAAPAA
jgi:hypothetical protein